MTPDRLALGPHVPSPRRIDLRSIIQSNADYTNTGYGKQTKYMVRMFTDLGLTIAQAPFYGLEGAIIVKDGIPLYPRAGNGYGDDITPAHAQHFQADVITALLDSWVLTMGQYQGQRLMLYAPIDHDPVPQVIANKLREAWLPVMYSRFALEQCQNQGIPALYAPHAIDTQQFSPIPMAEARTMLGWPQDRIILVTVAANKGYPSRKCWPEMMAAFAELRKVCPDALWYCHTNTSQNGEMGGMNLPAMAQFYGIEGGVLFPNQYQLHIGFDDSYLQAVYSAGNLFYLASGGEGFGVPCFPAGAQIATPSGVTVIERIKVGDQVFTHTGSIQRVTEVMSRPVVDEPGVRITARGNTQAPMVTTANHPVYAVQRLGRSLDAVKRDITNGETPQWIAAGDLAINDFLVLPRLTYDINEQTHIDLRPLAGISGDTMRHPNSNTGNRGVTARDVAHMAGVSLTAARRVLGGYEDSQVSARVRDIVTDTASRLGWKKPADISPDMPLCWDTGFFIGQYLAEGHIGNSGAIEFASHAAEAEIRRELSRIALDQWGLEAQEHIRGNSGRLFVTNRNLSQAIGEMCGRGSHNKHLPLFSFTNREFAEGLLVGMWMGDGSLSSQASSYTSVSPSLAHGMRSLLILFGIASTIRNDGKGAMSVIVNGAYAKLFFPLFARFSKQPEARDQIDRFFLMPTEHGWLCPITKRESVLLSEDVYNLEVEGDHSYCAEGFAVHNCWESLACGTPILTTEVTAQRDIVNAGVPGFYLPQEACEPRMTPLWSHQFSPRIGELSRLLISAVDTLSRLSPEERWEKYGKAGREFAEGYGIDEVREQYWRPIWQTIADRIADEGGQRFAGQAQIQRDINAASAIARPADRYAFWLNRWTDIQAHLPDLYDAGQGLVIELGARSGVSTSAFLAGVEAHGGMVYSVDTDPSCADLFDHPQWHFIHSSSLDGGRVSLAIREHSAVSDSDQLLIDTLFVDTDHTFAQVEAELAIYGPHVRPGGQILLHDMISFPETRRAAELWAQQHGMTLEIREASNGLGRIVIPVPMSYVPAILEEIVGSDGTTLGEEVLS